MSVGVGGQRAFSLLSFFDCGEREKVKFWALHAFTSFGVSDCISDADSRFRGTHSVQSQSRCLCFSQLMRRPHLSSLSLLLFDSLTGLCKTNCHMHTAFGKSFPSILANVCSNYFGNLLPEP